MMGDQRDFIDLGYEPLPGSAFLRIIDGLRSDTITVDCTWSDTQFNMSRQEVAAMRAVFAKHPGDQWWLAGADENREGLWFGCRSAGFEAKLPLVQTLGSALKHANSCDCDDKVRCRRAAVRAVEAVDDDNNFDEDFKDEDIEEDTDAVKSIYREIVVRKALRDQSGVICDLIVSFAIGC